MSARTVKRRQGPSPTIPDMDARRTATQRDYQERILRVLVHIQTHLDDALDAGYESNEAFTRAFARRFGVPPSDYRRLHRSAPGRRCSARATTIRTHHGAYEGLQASYAELIGRWMPAQNLRPAAGAPALEFYANSPEHVPESELRTRICIRLADA